MIVKAWTVAYSGRKLFCSESGAILLSLVELALVFPESRERASLHTKNPSKEPRGNSHDNGKSLFKASIADYRRVLHCEKY